MIDRTTFRALADLVRVVPGRRLASSLMLVCALSVTEGIGVLILLPLLRLVGVDADDGSSSTITRAVETALAAIGLQPTLLSVLGAVVLVAVLQGTLQRWHALLSAQVEQDIVASLRRRVYRAIVSVEWIFS
ncbi:MAG: hypothetical protein ACT4QD_02900 [Acidobacteriota bacterium]